MHGLNGMERLLEVWLKKSGGKKPPAIILGSSVNALSFARSLGRRRIPALILDSERLIGSYTRYGEFIQLSRDEELFDNSINALEFIGSRSEEKAVLFTTTDAHCRLMAHNRELLRQYFRFVVPDAETVESILNKRSQYNIAQSAGIPIPQTCFPESLEEAGHLAPTLTYPCLLKPYTSHTGRKVISNTKVLVAESQTELISNFERLMSSDQPFMIQEIVPGEDTALYSYTAFWNDEHQEIAWLTKQKLRQNPPQYGDGSLVITAQAPEVAELSRRLLRAFNYSGFVGVEFKFDERDSTYRLMEINPRTLSSNQLVISAGIDLPWIGYEYLTDSSHEPSPDYSFRPGVKYVNEEWDFQAYLALRKSGALNLRRWLRSIRGAKTAIGAWDDPLPLIAGFRRLLQIVWFHLKSAISSVAKQK